ncbi:MAG: sigma 54-interacting transcriptional regulator [Desulfobacteraceae bacterium]
MLIRVVCAVREKKLQTEFKQKLGDADVQLKFCSAQKSQWQELIRSCADVFVVSRSLIPTPIESSVAILNNLPEKPLTIILHERESSEEHANLLASGADVVLYTGIMPESLMEAIESTIESRRQYYYIDRFDQRGRLQPRLSDFTSKSEEMNLFIEDVRQIVSSDAGLLLLGETGVGKEHLSRAIHAESTRSGGPFIPINMAAVPEALMESEMFGHEQGAFTGALRARRGAFELAHTGTIFLDEIGEMPLHMQTKLLRVLQDFEFTPVGGESSVWVDVRVIAATNKNLEKEIKKGNFRWKLHMITETAGAVIVGEESCVGERGAQNLTADTGTTVDEMMDAIVDRYFKVDCAIFTPNPQRLEHIQDMVTAYNAQGVIHYGLQFCQPYLMESIPVEKALEEKNIPCLRVETDYGMEDMGQLKTRVEAFIEQLR